MTSKDVLLSGMVEALRSAAFNRTDRWWFCFGHLVEAMCVDKEVLMAVNDQFMFESGYGPVPDDHPEGLPLISLLKTVLAEGHWKQWPYNDAEDNVKGLIAALEKFEDRLPLRIRYWYWGSLISPLNKQPIVTNR